MLPIEITLRKCKITSSSMSTRSTLLVLTPDSFNLYFEVSRQQNSSEIQIPNRNATVAVIAMDLKSFSGESFDSKEWINAAFQHHHQLSSSGDHESREQFASSMVMKLQLLISKLNVSLEEQSELIGASMPRVLRETESIQSEAEVLGSKMTFIRAEVEQVNRETGSSMRQLMQMDLLKGEHIIHNY